VKRRLAMDVVEKSIDYGHTCGSVMSVRLDLGADCLGMLFKRRLRIGLHKG
jgi:hypothetical protein